MRNIKFKTVITIRRLAEKQSRPDNHRDSETLALINQIASSFFPVCRQAWLAMTIIVMTGCYPDEKLNEPVKTYDYELNEQDIYIQENFKDKYNIAVRYRYVSNYVSVGQHVAPSKLSVVIPMLEFIQEFWIDPYLAVDNGEVFFKRYVPSEIVFLGGLIYNNDNTVTLGTADAGARITFTNVNAIDPENEDWLEQQLHTVYHEFAHIVHQNFQLPTAYETISPGGYTSSGAWPTLTDEDALQRGFVSPYATSSVNEDFAETVAFFLFDSDFEVNFITPESNCTDNACLIRNEGREKINQKITSIKQHYLKVTGIDLDELRAEIQSRL